MDLRILAALLTFLKEMIVDNDRVRLFAKKERNEFTLLLALAFIFVSFFWYYTEADRLWYTNRELSIRLRHQTEFIETITTDKETQFHIAGTACTVNTDRLIKEIVLRDERIAHLEKRRDYLSNELVDALKRCK